MFVTNIRKQRHIVNYKNKTQMKTLFTVVSLLLFTGIYAQISADKIIDNYFENIGGKANWEKLEGIKLIGKSVSQGMEIPVEILQLKDGRQYVQITIQGKKLKLGVYDGEVVWNTNFMTQKAEAMTSEQVANFKKNEAIEFPSPFLNYKDKGYTIENLGEETMEGTACYKVKLTKNPVMIEGKEEQSIAFYYFDVDSFVPIAMEVEIPSGPMKGQMMKTTMSDYDEVDGLYFPFSMSQMMGPVTFEKIELNPTVEEGAFAMPVVKDEVKEEKKTPPPTSNNEKK